jgi:circadian clock protein KaiC
MGQGTSTVVKVSTGIEGLDDLLYGGIPEKNQILLLGDTGSGKTLLAFEIAYKAAKAGIPTTFLTLEEKIGALISFVEETFTDFTDLENLITSNKLNVEEKKLQYAIKSPENIQAIVAEIIRTAEQNNSKFLIIDSFSLLRSLYPDDRSFTRGINYIIESIRNQNVTTIITFETSKNNSESAPGLFEESMFDSIIKLSRKNVGNELKYLINIIKMRYSRFKSATRELTITTSGIAIASK